jgi:hypothetical protein
MAPPYVTKIGQVYIFVSAALHDWVGLHSALSAEFKTAVTLTLWGGKSLLPPLCLELTLSAPEAQVLSQNKHRLPRLVLYLISKLHLL